MDVIGIKSKSLFRVHLKHEQDETEIVCVCHCKWDNRVRDANLLIKWMNRDRDGVHEWRH